MPEEASLSRRNNRRYIGLLGGDFVPEVSLSLCLLHIIALPVPKKEATQEATRKQEIG